MIRRLGEWWATRPTTLTANGHNTANAGRAVGGTAEEGSATVELAASLPALMLMVVTALGAVSAVRTQLECVDAAREAVLIAARGGAGMPAGARIAPDGAVVTVVEGGDSVRATVRVRIHPLGGQLPGVDITATAVAAVEPGVEDG